jgi:hypothetical protein
MRLSLPFLLLGLCIASHAEPTQDAAKPVDASAEKMMQGRSRIVPPPPTLGVSLQKPDPMVTAQLPDLPVGIGFLVTAVDDGGPAAQAGVQVHDVIWKMGDQMLVNEAQIAALLRLHQPGEKVLFSAFRSGKPQQFKVQVGKPKARFSNVFAKAASSPEEFDNTVTRDVNASEMFAKTTGDDGEAIILRFEAAPAQGELVSGAHHRLCFESFEFFGGEGPGVGRFERWDVVVAQESVEEQEFDFATADGSGFGGIAHVGEEFHGDAVGSRGAV